MSHYLCFQDEDGVNHTYDLYAIANHVGSLNGGHYYADIRSFEDQQWYRFNDSLVDQVNHLWFLDILTKPHINVEACCHFQNIFRWFLFRCLHWEIFTHSNSVMLDVLLYNMSVMIYVDCFIPSLYGFCSYISDVRFGVWSGQTLTQWWSILAFVQKMWVNIEM